jgi:3'-phosphoadenosine 5'-phosphosulfate sulfotransferase (PAPS reductase)/FAD synthetase
MKEQIQKILNCSDAPLLEAIEEALNNFLLLSVFNSYRLCFSGGKDSHAILGIYLLAQKLNLSVPLVEVAFADTELEINALYELVTRICDWTTKHGIRLTRVKAKESYWYVQYALGYPVPNHFTRWCTSRLKVRPLATNGIISITGRHLGESIARDTRIKKTCGTNDCGTDKLKKTVEPIINFTNCQVLPGGNFNYLSDMYQKAQYSDKQSLRMGCFMCPVVSLNTIKKNHQLGIIDSEAVVVRECLEELRQARRVRSPKSGKKGAIYVVDRRENWNKLNKQYLLDKGWITEADVIKITSSLTSDYSYPLTYKAEWIDSQHKEILKSEKFSTDN